MNRFEGLQINERPVSLALFHYEDHFYDTALRQYDFKEALHLYLKRKGYDTIIFFSINKGIHSFEEEMLASFLNVQGDQPKVHPKQSIMPRVGRGTGRFDLQPHSSCDNKKKDALVYQDKDGFWVDKRSPKRDAQMKQIIFNLLTRQSCIVIIEPSYGSEEFIRDQITYLNDVIGCLESEKVKRNNNHFILLAKTTIYTGYNLPTNIDPSVPGKDHVKSNFWNNPYLLGQFFNSSKEEKGNNILYSLKNVDKPFGPVWVLPSPTSDDCKNAFQYWRIVNGMKWSIRWCHIGDIMSQISHVRGKYDDEQPKTLNEWEKIFCDMNSVSYSAFDKKYGIKDRNGEEARKKLANMQGIDRIRNQFEVLCERLAIERNNPKTEFRPHMAFLGSPGTGKTTVARRFAEILKDKGLLSVGHLVEVSPADFIGEYVGQTRPKASKVCESAIGGVLFIDEAYGLHKKSDSQSNGNTFGDEAIDMIIQYMENYKNDLIVIFAGYDEETRYMIDHGNSGTKSRIDKDLGYYFFKPYSPEVLFNIVMFKLSEEGWQTTSDFQTSMRNIILIEHSLGQTENSNARYAEQIAGELLSSYKDKKEKMGFTLDKIHIPEKRRRLIDPSLLDESIVFDEIDKLVGQNHLKNSLRDLYDNCVVQMTQAGLIPGYIPQLPQLGFVIMGPSGTGKTTFAHAIANILYYLGLMPGDNSSYFTTTTGVDILQKRYTAEVLLQENLGKTLFIDEAYGLLASPNFVNDFVGEMQKPKFKNKLCVILAGYEDDIKRLMSQNQGLPNRFPEDGRFILSNYTDEDLAEMLFRRQNNRIRLSEECRPLAIDYFSKERQKKAAANDPSKPFGNAREVDTLLGKLKTSSNKRYRRASEEQQADPIFASLILPEDFPNYNTSLA